MTVRFLSVLAAAALFAALRPAPAATQQPARPYKVIVNAENPVGLLTGSEIAKLFLRKTTLWSHNGQPVLPVELDEGTAVRQAFLRDIERKDAAAIQNYWQQMVFSGKAVPPPTRGSDAEVMEYVRTNENSIGYVSSSTQLTPDLKPITILR